MQWWICITLTYLNTLQKPVNIKAPASLIIHMWFKVHDSYLHMDSCYVGSTEVPRKAEIQMTLPREAKLYETKVILSNAVPVQGKV